MEGSVKKGSLNKDQAQGIASILDSASLSEVEKSRQLRDRLVEAYKVCNGQQVALGAAAKKAEKHISELEAANRVKSTLEKLCRELREQNKSILAASKKASEAEAAHREATHLKFQGAIDDVSEKIKKQADLERTALELHDKLEKSAKRLELTEEHHAKQLEAKEIEIKLAKAQKDHEVHLLTGQLKEAQLRDDMIGKLVEENKILKQTVQAYKENFEKLTGTMSRSEKMYDSIRGEMTALSKGKATLENENKQLASRLAKLTLKHKTESKESSNTISKQSTQIDKLKSLCRDLKNKLDREASSPAPQHDPSDESVDPPVVPGENTIVVDQ
mmetsp:Transcript_12849/g.23819  ORF Transcript_12849/g.23819 Transcript_12849/m.23819 type:complete len:331 (+) Transcript_12849:53-1045(+)